ncbi:MAG TPA: DUF3300 domain-containing protein [Thermoanaerobaculaceae bacterium]|nr:DUF3300 domain-containing protein [Thermoanaerobaculaceae bacterium]
MQSFARRSRFSDLTLRGALALVCAAMLVPGNVTLMAQQAPAAATAAPEQAAKLPPEQLDSLVAPIALYPDPLLAQTLAASTYPLEIIQLQQWMAKNPNLKDKALADAVAKQPWDPSVQSMAALPDVVKRLADDIQWTTDLGNAFLSQQSDVMDAVQRMRKKAKGNGALETNEQQKVETKVVETKEVIVIESASPEVIYVPSYSPTVVYGPPVYPYPPIYYPPYPPGAAFVSFSFGVMMGAAIWGGACCGCGWGHNDVNINVNNNFNRNNINTGGNRGGGNNWQHNSQHRGAAPYADKATASKYGGSARGDSRSTRQASAGQQQARGGASASQQGARTSGGATASSRSAGASSASRGSSPSARGGGFGGGSGGFSGKSARASSSRGASSMGGRGGGGRRR